MKEVTLGVKVKIPDGVQPNNYEVAAKEILFSAPAFDGFTDVAIEQLEVIEVDDNGAQ